MLSIWLPYVQAGSGADSYTKQLAAGLEDMGHKIELTAFKHAYQYLPWKFKRANAPADTDIILANSWNAFAFTRPNTQLVVIEHHCVLDPAYSPYRNIAQSIFHQSLVRHFETRSFRRADAIVTVSNYTADVVGELFPGTSPETIYNGIDTEFFCPGDSNEKTLRKGPFQLLFVGNPSPRKGGDLLPKIMALLGNDFVLNYTSGLRDLEARDNISNMRPIGRLSKTELLQAYRNADLLLFPSRMEGFGLAAVEAMACGTPVVCSDTTALPEVVIDGETGALCRLDDVPQFAETIRQLAADRDQLSRMGHLGRDRALKFFSLKTMTTRYEKLFNNLVMAKQK